MALSSIISIGRSIVLGMVWLLKDSIMKTSVDGTAPIFSCSNEIHLGHLDLIMCVRGQLSVLSLAATSFASASDDAQTTYALSFRNSNVCGLVGNLGIAGDALRSLVVHVISLSLRVWLHTSCTRWNWILNPLALLKHSAIAMERYSGGGEAITILAAICNNQLEKLRREGWYCF